MSEDGDRWLEETIRGLPPRSPPPGWERRVRASIAEPVRRPRWTWAWVGVATAVTAIALWFLWPRPAGLTRLAVATHVVPGPDVVRGDTAKVGDTWVIEATIPRNPSWDVRVYRDRKLIASCVSRGCGRQGDHVLLDVKLDEAGQYRAVVMAGPRLPASTGQLDLDIGAGGDAGVEAVMTPALEVELSTSNDRR